MTFGSALYVGAVMHRRWRPTSHQFRYQAFWLLIDLDELPELTARLRLFSHNGFNLFALHEADHGDGSATSLRVQAEQCLSEAGIDLAGGPIRLLCMPRTLGYSFNPIGIYFCHRPCGELAAIIYEVHNTFGERHSYVSCVESNTGPVQQSCRKEFYVSPFMDMDLVYDFRLIAPAERVSVRINANKGPDRVITALSHRRAAGIDGRSAAQVVFLDSFDHGEGHSGDPLGSVLPLDERVACAQEAFPLRSTRHAEAPGGC